jgi:hypothetical protein
VTVKETYNNEGILIERVTSNTTRSIIQIVALAMLLLSIFALVATRSIMAHWDGEFPVWFWVTDAIAPLVSCAMFAIYEMVR